MRPIAHADPSSGAIFSACRRYRYRLWRSWGDRANEVVFCALNGSTATEDADDPTIRKDIGFAKRWGFGRMVQINLFGWMATRPRGLLAAGDPVGPESDEIIAAAVRSARRVVFCWGTHGPVQRIVAARAEVVRTAFVLSGADAPFRPASI